MNNITVQGTVWLASDMHLGPASPHTRDAFLKFLEQACAQADALFLCGDIFDTWIGDDLALTDPPAWLDEVLLALARTAKAIPVWLGRGNRDFLIGPGLTSHLGARLLKGPVCLDTPQGHVLVSHGDEYCTADLGYQRFKRIVHTGWIQRVFLRLSLERRQAIAEWARRRSMASHGGKAPEIMDVTPDAVLDAFRHSGAAAMIHGHTHRPAVHGLRVDGAQRLRVVLPDWDLDHEPSRGGWAVIDTHGIRLQPLVQ
ncbi:MAG TPA: UDP-2,3-diacylglucosamine diphosphatase [Pusillimonas sp.]|uniref:UDP-2,3-diacylglucosamine diphosphatase n=1 Tax=Pusillimonas sp. TaxID=3040095 RepID=UPI002CD80D64|nr:UDP-2,3-diacylglucosamine diphosphatase [Pusillimonas sp.]HUH87135.1 UDP-2,3-diacylglucosamine diphosphatase [Pusillimonas sp.]